MANDKKTGPKEDRLKIEGDWSDAMKKALKKERPKGSEWENKDKSKKG